MNRNRFWVGVILILASSAVGWLALAAGLALSVTYGKTAATVGMAIYAASWIPFVIGFYLSGKEGVRQSRELISKLFQKRRPPAG